MANILITKNGRAVELLLSVNTPDYDKDVNNIVNPDISSVVEIPIKYWKVSDGKVLEMTAQEKLTVNTDDRSKTLTDVSANIGEYITIVDLIEVLIKIGNTQWSQGKTVTKVQILDALYEEVERRI